MRFSLVLILACGSLPLAAQSPKNATLRGSGTVEGMGALINPSGNKLQGNVMVLGVIPVAGIQADGAPVNGDVLVMGTFELKGTVGKTIKSCGTVSGVAKLKNPAGQEQNISVKGELCVEGMPEEAQLPSPAPMPIKMWTVKVTGKATVSGSLPQNG